MPRISTTVLGLVSAGVLALSGAFGVAAAPPADAHAPRAHLERLQAALDLTEDQLNAIRQLHQGQRDTRRQLARQLHEARRALRDLVLQGADDAAIQAKTAEVQQLLGQMVQLGVDLWKGYAQILTPEQREKLAKLRPRMPWMRRGAALGGAPGV